MLQTINKHRLTAYALWAGLFFWTFILVLRRNAAAFPHDLPLFAFCIVLTIFTCFSLAALIQFLNWRPDKIFAAPTATRQRSHIVPIVITTTLPLVLGITLPTNQIIFAIVFTLGTTLVAALSAFAFTGQLQYWLELAADRLDLTVSISDSIREPDSRADQIDLEMQHTETNQHLLMQQSRSIDADGRDCLTGMLEGQFVPGQKQLMLHLQFQPPFPNTPTLDMHLLDDVDVRLKLGALYPYGARIEARRSGNAESGFHFQIEYCAQIQVIQAESA